MSELPFSTNGMKLEALTEENYEHYLADFHTFLSSDYSTSWSAIPTTSIEESRLAVKDLLTDAHPPDRLSYIFLVPEEDNLLVKDKEDVLVGDEDSGRDKDKEIVGQEVGQVKRGKMVGFCATGWGRAYQELGLEYSVLENEKSKGYATAGLQMFLELFWTLPVQRDLDCLEVHVANDNFGSLRIMEKLGARMGEEVVGEEGSLCYYLDRPVTE